MHAMTRFPGPIDIEFILPKSGIRFAIASDYGYGPNRI